MCPQAHNVQTSAPVCNGAPTGDGLAPGTGAKEGPSRAQFRRGMQASGKVRRDDREPEVAAAVPRSGVACVLCGVVDNRQIGWSEYSQLFPDGIDGAHDFGNTWRKGRTVTRA